MDVCLLVVNNLSTAAEKLVYNAGDRLFVAGNGGGRDDNSVACLDIQLLVTGESHAVEGTHRLARTACCHYDNLLGRQVFNLVQLH